jgi:hypothetical protein
MITYVGRLKHRVCNGAWTCKELNSAVFIKWSTHSDSTQTLVIAAWTVAGGMKSSFNETIACFAPRLREVAIGFLPSVGSKASTRRMDCVFHYRTLSHLTAGVAAR